MMRTGIALAVILAGTGAVLADDDWAGLYQGIDIVDGSHDVMSIVPNGDGTYDIRVKSTGLAYCDDGARPGVIRAEARVEAGQLVREKVAYRCEGEAGFTDMEDGTYVRDDETGILTIEVRGGRLNHYHRMSED